MTVLSRSATIDAPADRVFTYVDDIRNLARHMSEGASMPMMGSKLFLDIVTEAKTGMGAVYRYSGRIMGLAIEFSETVTRYVPGREKVWHTIGEPRLFIIDTYEMAVRVEALTAAESRLTVTIDYRLPRTGFWRGVGHLLAAPYARWCLNSMIAGTVHDLAGRP